MANINSTDFRAMAGLLVASNRQKTIDALREEGYRVSTSATPAQLVSVLTRIFNTNKQAFARVLAKIPFNAGAYTTDQQERIGTYVSSVRRNAPLSRACDWTDPNTYLNCLAGSSEDTKVTDPTVETSEPVLGVGAIVTIATVAMTLIGTLIYFGTKSSS